MIKAVVVGINVYKNYPDQSLAGCINDAEDVLDFLSRRGTGAANITPLYDARASKAAILQAVRDMIASSVAGDHLLLHYSGHGTQIASSDVNEPDALDEVLCPADFNFSDRNSALTDNEIAQLVATLPANVAWTLVVDACHSGDLLKEFRDVRDAKDAKEGKGKDRPRFLRPPADLAWRLKKRTLLPRKRALTGGNGVSISACTTMETAADTSFSGRPNGAFTHFWLETLGAAADASLDALVKTVGASLTTYNMHPEVQGPSDLRAAGFLADPPMSSRAPMVVQRAAVGGRTLVQFEAQWAGAVMGIPVSLGLRVLQPGVGFIFELTPGVAGAKFSVPVPVNGNVSIPIPVTLLGQVVVDIGGWSPSGTHLDCDIAVRVVPSLPFVQTATLAQQHLSIPLRMDDRAFAVPQSASDIWAMLELLRRSLPALPQGGQPTHRAITAADNTPFSAKMGQLDWGPNWREDRAILVGSLPHNQIRTGEPIFFNQKGAGQVSFMNWLNDDPSDASFVVHIGNGFFGGWGSIQYQVMAIYGNIDIVMRDMQPRDASGTRYLSPSPAPSSPGSNGASETMPSDHGIGNGNGAPSQRVVEAAY